MKICTITSHDVYNYGASLQAYALMTYLKEQGHDVQIINYLPEYEIRRYSLTHIHEGTIYYKIANKLPILRSIIALLYNRRDFKFWGRKRAFDKFTKEELSLTERIYENYKDLETNPPPADLYIAGSDQIWNTEHGKGKDPAFYLEFVHNRDKCISYAASFATPYIAKPYIDFVTKGLSNFSHISVRESTGVEIAKGLGYDSVQVMDPTFLLQCEEWEKLLSKVNPSIVSKTKEKYALLYNFVENDDRIDDYALKVAKKNGIKLVSLNDGYTRKFADVNINNAGPIDFIYLIKNADFVICNSFHATVFSIIFKKNFFTFPLIGANSSSRMKDLLKLFELSDRFLGNEIEETNCINWDGVNFILNKESIKSKDWLLTNLNYR